MELGFGTSVQLQRWLTATTLHTSPHHFAPNRLDKEGAQGKVSMGLQLGLRAGGVPAWPCKVWPTHPQRGGLGGDGGRVPRHTGVCLPRCHGPASGGHTGPGCSGHTGSSWCGGGPCDGPLRGRKRRGGGVIPGPRGGLSAPSQPPAPLTHRSPRLIFSNTLLWVMRPFCPQPILVEVPLSVSCCAWR